MATVVPLFYSTHLIHTVLTSPTIPLLAHRLSLQSSPLGSSSRQWIQQHLSSHKDDNQLPHYFSCSDCILLLLQTLTFSLHSSQIGVICAFKVQGFLHDTHTHTRRKTIIHSGVNSFGYFCVNCQTGVSGKGCDWGGRSARFNIPSWKVSMCSETNKHERLTSARSASFI